MKLEKEEIKKIKDLVMTYRKLHSEVGVLEEQMKKLNSDKNYLILEMEETRKEEIDFVTDLREKYGERVITPDLLKKIVLC